MSHGGTPLLGNELTKDELEVGISIEVYNQATILGVQMGPL
jgi:hypothetical protein